MKTTILTAILMLLALPFCTLAQECDNLSEALYFLLDKTKLL